MDAKERVSQYRTLMEDGDHEGALSVAEDIQDADCSVCQSIGASLGGYALAASNGLNEALVAETEALADAYCAVLLDVVMSD